MSGLFSEFNKINNVLAPKLQSSGTGDGPVTSTGHTDTDIVNLANYKKCTFIATYGTCIADFDGTFRVFAGSSAGLTATTGCATPIPFYYRSSVISGGSAATTDGQGTLTAGTSDGLVSTTGVDGMMYIFEVDAPTVAAAGSSDGVEFHRCKLRWTHTTSASGPREWGVTAILSEPRYVQDILVTAID